MTYSKFVKFGLSTLAVVASCMATAAASENDLPDNGPLGLGQDKFMVSIGAFIADFNSRMAIDPASTEGNKSISIEDDLGLKSAKTVFRAEAYWRFAKRHRIQAAYYFMARSGDNVLENEIEWEDATYPVGAKVDSMLDLQVIPINYAYSFIQNDRWEVAGTVGVHWIKLKASIQGEAFVGDETISVENREESGVKGPFPLVGLSIDYRPAPRWQIGTSMEWLDLSIGKYSGRLWDVKVYVEYYFARNWGVGLGYNFTDVKADVKEDDWAGRMDIVYSGLLAYITTKF